MSNYANNICRIDKMSKTSWRRTHYFTCRKWVYQRLFWECRVSGVPKYHCVPHSTLGTHWRTLWCHVHSYRLFRWCETSSNVSTNRWSHRSSGGSLQYETDNPIRYLRSVFREPWLLCSFPFSIHVFCLLYWWTTERWNWILHQAQSGTKMAWVSSVGGGCSNSSKTTNILSWCRAYISQILLTKRPNADVTIVVRIPVGLENMV